MNITTDERSKWIFSSMGQKGPTFSDAKFYDYPILAGKTFHRDFSTEGISKVGAPLAGAFSRQFSFKVLPVFEREGLWFSEHLDMSDARFGRAWQIYTESFADYERRTFLEQGTVHSHPNYRFSAILDGDAIVGVLACWSLSGFWLVEHVAIDSRQRSSGLGSRVIRLLQEHVKGPIMLDVEPLYADPHAERRVAFYERLGFHFCGEPVSLPPYEGKPEAPSHLMAWPHALDAEGRACAVATIEREVYGLGTCASRACAV